MSEIPCVAHNRQGEPCGRSAIPGGTVCRYHGGSIQRVKRKAAERVALAKAEGLLDRIADIEPVDDPLKELLLIAGRSKRLMVMLEEKVNDLHEIRFEDDKGSEQMRGELAAYMATLDRCRAVLVDILRLGIEDRLARIEERHVEMLATALEKTLKEMGLADRAEEATGRVARHLAVAAG